MVTAKVFFEKHSAALSPWWSAIVEESGYPGELFYLLARRPRLKSDQCHAMMRAVPAALGLDWDRPEFAEMRADWAEIRF